MNVAAARVAREAAEEAHGRDGRQRFVAGAVGPTNMTLSISPRVEDPGFRSISFADLAAAYEEQIDALIEGGVDLLLIETIFDTLNAKAAIVAARRSLSRAGKQLPLMISGTITDRSGRTLSGQTPAAFWQSIRHAQPLTVGLNCALGAEEMRPHIEEISAVADTLLCVYPNAGLPNELGDYDEGPETTAGFIKEFAEAGLVNIVGGCCGTTPPHIGAIAKAVVGLTPRVVPTRTPRLELSGLEPFYLTDDIPFVNVGERTNITGSAKFRRLIKENDYAAALDVARDQVENGAQIIDVNMDDGLIDGVEAMTTFLNLIAGEPEIARVPVMIDSSKFSRDRGRAAVRAGQADRQLDLDEGRRRPVPRTGAHLPRLRRRRDRDGLRRGRPGRHRRAQGRHRPAGVPPARRRGRLPARRHHHRPEHLRHRHRHGGARPLRARLHRGDQADHRRAAVRQHLGRRLEPVVLVPRQRAGARSDALGVPAAHDRGRHAARHRQRRPARRVRPDRPRAARAVRGRRARPPPRRHRAAARRRGPVRRHRRGGRRPGRRRNGVRGTSTGGSSMRSSTASPPSSKKTSRRPASPPDAPST